MTHSKVILVTGGARGIGESIVRECVRGGYSVVFTYNSSSEEAAALQKELKRGGETVCEAIKCDLSVRDECRALIQQIKALDKPIFGYVHNAGYLYDRLFVQMDVDDAKKLMDVMYWSFLEISKSIIPAMRHARSGRIVALSSLAAKRSLVGNGVYSSAKAAVESACRTITVENARRGITANSIAPGYIETGILKNEDISNLAGSIPSKRLGTPMEVAALVVFLLSENAKYINGSSLILDGGMAAGGG